MLGKWEFDMIVDFIVGTLIGFGIGFVILLLMLFIGFSNWMDSGSH